MVHQETDTIFGSDDQRSIGQQLQLLSGQHIAAGFQIATGILLIQIQIAGDLAQILLIIRRSIGTNK